MSECNADPYATANTDPYATANANPSRLDSLDIYDEHAGLRAISPAKVLALLDAKDAEFKRLEQAMADALRACSDQVRGEVMWQFIHAWVNGDYKEKSHD
jgi:hypothetical protein